MIVPAEICVGTLPSVLFTERKRLPHCAAIYFVLNTHETILYIGKSIDLAGRWIWHHRAKKLAAHHATRIAWLVMEETTFLTAVETACINYFNPLCNGRDTPGLSGEFHLKTTPGLRNRISGKLRMRGVTMQSFFVDLMEIIDKDEALLELLEHKRDALKEQRELVEA